MQSDKLIVVAGAAGKLGRLVVESLLQHEKVSVRALVRDPKRPEVLAMAGERVQLLAFDASTASEAERAAAVRGAFAVVSTLQGGPDVIVDGQLALLRAAKAAGARRFLPSDFSYDFFELPEGVNVNSDWRRAFAGRADAEVGPGFEIVHVLQGIFADQYVLGFLGVFDAQAGAIRYWGDGTTPIDWTTWEDTARFTAAAAVDGRALPARLFVSGERMSILQFAERWEAARGRKLERIRLGSLDELEAEAARRVGEEPSNIYAWLPLMYARGVFGGRALLGASHNRLFPEIHPERVDDAIARGAL